MRSRSTIGSLSSTCRTRPRLGELSQSATVTVAAGCRRNPVGSIPGTGLAVENFHEALLEDDAEQLYDRAPCGYLSTTPDGTIIMVNQTFLTLTGYDRGQLVGQLRFAQLLSAGGRIYYETHYAPMLSMHGQASVTTRSDSPLL